MRCRPTKTIFALLLCAGLAALALVGGGEPAMAKMHDRAARLAHLGSEYPLLGDDGRRLANHSVKLATPIDTMPGVVVAANPQGRTTLVEFYDLNCPYCRMASRDIADMVETDPDLRLVLVPYPVLGIASISASRVELAVAKLGSPTQFYEFQRAVYAQHGTTDGTRALDVARKLGLDEAAVTKLGNSDEITRIMKAHVALGDSLGLAGTPSFVIDGVAIVGYPGRDGLQKIVDATRSCGKVYCDH